MGKASVLMVEPLGDGGIAHYTYNLAKALYKNSIDVSVFTNQRYELRNRCKGFSVQPRMFRIASWVSRHLPWFDGEGGLADYLRRTVKLVEYPVNTLEALCLAGRQARDIVHLQSVNEVELIMVLAFRAAKKRIVFTVHNIRPRHGKLTSCHKALFRLMYSLCDAVIIHTESGKRELEEMFAVPPATIHVIPHGDYKFFTRHGMPTKAQAREKLGLPKESKALLFFGAIRPNKGLDSAVLALSEIVKTLPKANLMIVGEPVEDYGRYRDLIQKNNLSGHVFEHLGYVPNNEVGLYFSAADLVILPYNEVTGSGVLHIAYAFAKPVVTTDLPGFRETVEDGINGYIVSCGDIDRMAKRIIEVLCDDRKMEAMGKHSHLLSERYSWEGVAQKTISVYSAIAEISRSES